MRNGSPSGLARTVAPAKEYPQALQITKLAEVLLDTLLAAAPRNPMVLLSRKCAELHEQVKADPANPTPWVQQRIDPSAYSDREGTSSSFSLATKDYICRERVACIFDDWYLILVSSKPPSPALFSKNYFLQRSVARALARMESGEASSSEPEEADEVPPPPSDFDKTGGEATNSVDFSHHQLNDFSPSRSEALSELTDDRGSSPVAIQPEYPLPPAEEDGVRLDPTLSPVTGNSSIEHEFEGTKRGGNEESVPPAPPIDEPSQDSPNDIAVEEHDASVTVSPASPEQSP